MSHQQMLLAVGGGSGPSSAWATAVNALSPLGWWRLGEASGSAINSGSVGSADMSPQNVGSLTRNVSGLVTGDSNGAAQSATNGYFETAMPSGLDVSRDFTFAAWINLATTGVFHPIISGSAGGVEFVVNNAQRLQIYQTAGANIGTGATTLSVSTRYFVALTVASGGTAAWTLYVNGSSDASGTTATTFTASSLYLFYDGFNSFRGILDEALIFGSALSGMQVAALYAAGV